MAKKAPKRSAKLGGKASTDLVELLQLIYQELRDLNAGMGMLVGGEVQVDHSDEIYELKDVLEDIRSLLEASKKSK